VIFSYFLFRI